MRLGGINDGGVLIDGPVSLACRGLEGTEEGVRWGWGYCQASKEMVNRVEKGVNGFDTWMVVGLHC